MKDDVNATILKEYRKKLVYIDYGDDCNEEVNLNPRTNPIAIPILDQVMLDIL